MNNDNQSSSPNNSTTNQMRGQKRSRKDCLLPQVEDNPSSISHDHDVQVDILPLSTVNALLTSSNRTIVDNDNSRDSRNHSINQQRVRIVRPYAYTFATFAKARWIDRTVLDVYCSEFGECLFSLTFSCTCIILVKSSKVHRS